MKIKKIASVVLLSLLPIAYVNAVTAQKEAQQAALQAYEVAVKQNSNNADSWIQVGELLERVGELDKAEAAYEKGKTLGSEEEQFEVIWRLARTIQTRKDNDTIEYYQKALATNEALGKIEDMVDYSNRLASLYKENDDYDKAIEMYQKSLAIHQSLDSKKGVAGVAEDFIHLGLVYHKRGDLDKAIEMYQKSLAIDESLGSSGNKNMMSNNYTNLGKVYHKRGDLDKAIEMYEKDLQISALRISENETLDGMSMAFTIEESMAKDYGDLGNLYKAKGNKAEAKRYYQKSIDLYKKLKFPSF